MNSKAEFFRLADRTYGELTLGDVITFLVVALTGPITLLALLTKYLDRFKILKK